MTFKRATTNEEYSRPLGNELQTVSVLTGAPLCARLFISERLNSPRQLKCHKNTSSSQKIRAFADVRWTLFRNNREMKIIAHRAYSKAIKYVLSPPPKISPLGGAYTHHLRLREALMSNGSLPSKRGERGPVGRGVPRGMIK